MREGGGDPVELGPPPTGLPVLEDRWCRPRALDNPVRRWLFPAVRDMERLDPPVGGWVVDLGAGIGFHAVEWLRRIGPQGRLVLVDPDAENLALTPPTAAADRRLERIVAPASRVPQLPSDAIDRVLLSFVLCCLVDKEGALDETWRILRPGGRALVCYPRARRTPSRRRPLRMTVRRWEELQSRHAWSFRPVRGNRFVDRHLLEKPVA
ncbi:MAG: methyltransferase domain-containing protein [Thermoplasmata archaeon]|nr:methyltransferase domain-containing protein [Thermoplasmata archaeon]